MDSKLAGIELSTLVVELLVQLFVRPKKLQQYIVNSEVIIQFWRFSCSIFIVSCSYQHHKPYEQVLCFECAEFQCLWIVYSLWFRIVLKPIYFYLADILSIYTPNIGWKLAPQLDGYIDNATNNNPSSLVICFWQILLLFLTKELEIFWKKKKKSSVNSTDLNFFCKKSLIYWYHKFGKKKPCS